MIRKEVNRKTFVRAKIKSKKKNRSDKNGVASVFVLYGYFVEACLLQYDNTIRRMFCKINSYKSNNKK